MDIAAMSMNLSSAKLQMSVGISMTKKVMEQQSIEADSLMRMMDSVPLDGTGQLINIKV